MENFLLATPTYLSVISYKYHLLNQSSIEALNTVLKEPTDHVSWK